MSKTVLNTLLFAFSFLLSLTGAWLLRKFSRVTGFYDYPQFGLKEHKEAVPYAGTSVWVSFMAVLAGLRLFTSFETGTLHALRGIVYGGTLVFILGIFDDLYDLHFLLKFLFQGIAAGIIIAFDIKINIFPVPALNIAVSVFWLILVINAVNIIDIKDGLASGVAALSAFGFFLVTLPTERFYVNFASIIIGGALLGFWVLNKPPAKVFLGDGGSLFTGFILAALSMGADYSSHHPVGLFAPLFILGIPLYDTLLVSYFRFREGKSIFKGSKDHYALRLQAAGLSDWQIDLVSYAVSALLSAAAFAVTVLPAGAAFFLAAVVLFTGLIGSAALSAVNPE